MNANERAGLEDLGKDQPMMNVDEVAACLRVHKITIYRLLKADAELGQFKIGRVWRFNREGVVRFADGGSGAGPV